VTCTVPEDRLTTQWQDDAAAFGKRSLAETDYVYCWVDGIHLKVRLAQDKVCLLVIIGVRADGTKELIALADGFRESSQSWADLLRDCKRRGMRAPVLAVGDGALGLWKALREVFPTTGEQRCWFHVSATSSPRCPSPRTRAPGLHSQRSTTPRTASTPSSPRRRSRSSTARSGPRRSPRSPSTSTCSSPSTTSPPNTGSTCARRTRSGSTFATVRLRQRVTKGPGSRAAGVAMAFKLIESAQTRWRVVNAPHLVALVRAGARFEKGKLVERPDESGGNQQAV